jgi:hypothetical protein
MGRHTDTVKSLNIIFHKYIEKSRRTDKRTLVNSILQIDALISTAEVKNIVIKIPPHSWKEEYVSPSGYGRSEAN